MKLIQEYSISMISSASLYSPPLTSVILSLLSYYYFDRLSQTHQNHINKSFKFQINSLNTIHVDERPQILYIRKTENQQYSQKVMEFETSITKDVFVPDNLKSYSNINLSLLSNYCIDQDEPIKQKMQIKTSTNNIIQESLFFIVSIGSITSIILGNLKFPTQQGNVYLLIIYIINSAFGNVLSQFGKHIDPAIQILFVNISLIPLATWLSIQEIQHSEFHIFNKNPSNTWLQSISYDQYVFFLVLVIFIGQCTQLLSTYKKIQFFQKHDSLVQQRLVFIPTICKVLIDMFLQSNSLNYLFITGTLFLSIISIIQLWFIYIDYRKHKTQRNDDYLPI